MLSNKLERKIIRLSQEIVLARQPKRPIHITFLARKSHIIAIGINKINKTSPLSNAPYKFIHSEVDAIAKVKQEDILSKVTLINVRISRALAWMESKPCTYCDSLINLFGIKKVIYTTGFNSEPEWQYGNN